MAFDKVETYLKTVVAAVAVDKVLGGDQKEICFYYKNEAVHLIVALGGTSAHSHLTMSDHQNTSLP